jgi:formate dehydrogenase subunit gamma
MVSTGTTQTIQAEAIKSVVMRHKDIEGPLLPILHEIQAIYGYIPNESVEVVAALLNLSRAEVHGVISFYHHFSDKPRGKHVIEVCCAESCQAVGGREIEAKAKNLLKLDWHQTSSDQQFTLEPVYCLGNCACSPSVRVGKEVYGRMDKERLTDLVNELSTEPLSFSMKGSQ